MPWRAGWSRLPQPAPCPRSTCQHRCQLGFAPGWSLLTPPLGMWSFFLFFEAAASRFSSPSSPAPQHPPTLSLAPGLTRRRQRLTVPPSRLAFAPSHDRPTNTSHAPSARLLVWHGFRPSSTALDQPPTDSRQLRRRLRLPSRATTSRSRRHPSLACRRASCFGAAANPQLARQHHRHCHNHHNPGDNQTRRPPAIRACRPPAGRLNCLVRAARTCFAVSPFRRLPVAPDSGPRPGSWDLSSRPLADCCRASSLVPRQPGFLATALERRLIDPSPIVATQTAQWVCLLCPLSLSLALSLKRAL